MLVRLVIRMISSIDNKKYYQSGMLMAADKDDKYAVVKVNKTGSNVNYVQIMTTDEFLKDMEDNFNVVSVVTDTNKYSEEYTIPAAVTDSATVEYRVVNTSGTVQKSKSKAKDGNDRCYEVASNGNIVRVFVEN